MNRKVCIGSRESALAVIQTELVRDYIRAAHPEMQVEILTMKTTGDKILDRTLDKVGGKGLFVKELDKALLEKRSDLSVHSLKDMPMEVSEELPLVAYSKREDPRDVLVLPRGESKLDPGKPIGCSSQRRTLQLKSLFPHMQCRPVRGNVLTRLKKLDEGEYSALVLAAAGLKRLGMEDRISRYFEPEEMIPAAGQGILGIQGRKGEDYGFLDGFNDRDARDAAICERAFVRTLDGGCSSPVAAHARTEKDQIRLLGLYYDETTKRYRKGVLEGKREDAQAIGRELALRLKRESAGKVWLVGAGPSDPGLFTRKGEQVLKEADVVVYDALVGQAILNMIPEHARLIDVGKRASHHTMKQEQINEVLVEEAKKGKRVVRLKGGDPFLFGRGGEELELLKQEGIPFEVVPGVTSALSVPAYNGIPVTHRDYCSSVHIITGHKRAGKSYDIDFEALVRTRGTLVFLMGAAALPQILSGLLQGGMDPDMPAAVLQKGTTAAQKRIVATVSSLSEEVKRQGIETPAIIVVGKVCALANEFAWYEKQPLAGRKILVTRPREIISGMAARLRSQGAEVLELPAIRTVPREEDEALQKAFSRLGEYDWVVFTSPAGVRIFFDKMKDKNMDIRSLFHVRFAVIGEGTGKALKERGFYPDLMPKEYYGEALGDALAEILKGDEKILIPRASIGNQELVKRIKKSDQIQVDDIPIYDTIYESSLLIDEKAEFENKAVDYAVFTSASTVKGFAQAVKGLDFSTVKAVCIGRQTRAAARELGMITYMSEKPTMDSVVKKVVELCTNPLEKMEMTERGEEEWK